MDFEKKYKDVMQDYHTEKRLNRDALQLELNTYLKVLREGLQDERTDYLIEKIRFYSKRLEEGWDAESIRKIVIYLLSNA